LTRHGGIRIGMAGRAFAQSEQLEYVAHAAWESGRWLRMGPGSPINNNHVIIEP